MGYGSISWKSKADGWEPVEDEMLIAMLKNTTNTPWEISAFGGRVIVPKWVLEAVESYKKVGGYAGMSLGEWIDKISDGRPKEPLHTF